MLLQKRAKEAAFSLHKYKCPLWKLSSEISNLFLKHALQKASKKFFFLNPAFQSSIRIALYIFP